MKLNELYPSVFAVSYHIPAGKWPDGIDSDFHKAIAVVTMPQAFVLLSIYMWVQIFLHWRSHIPSSILFFGLLCLYYLNYYFLRKSRIYYLEKYALLSNKQKIVRIAVTVLIVLGTALSIYFSALAYRAAFAA